jgi:hypothetical protein
VFVFVFGVLGACGEGGGEAVGGGGVGSVSRTRPQAKRVEFVPDQSVMVMREMNPRGTGRRRYLCRTNHPPPCPRLPPSDETPSDLRRRRWAFNQARSNPPFRHGSRRSACLHLSCPFRIATPSPPEQAQQHKQAPFARSHPNQSPARLNPPFTYIDAVIEPGRVVRLRAPKQLGMVPAPMGVLLLAARGGRRPLNLSAVATDWLDAEGSEEEEEQQQANRGDRARG